MRKSAEVKKKIFKKIFRLSGRLSFLLLFWLFLLAYFYSINQKWFHKLGLICFDDKRILDVKEKFLAKLVLQMGKFTTLFSKKKSVKIIGKNNACEKNYQAKAPFLNFYWVMLMLAYFIFLCSFRKRVVPSYSKNNIITPKGAVFFFSVKLLNQKLLN
jgi:hypothetical protein